MARQLSLVVALALSASVSAFNPSSTRRFAAPRSARVTARFAEEAAAPAAEAEATEPAEPAPPAYQASIALPFMPNPEALDGSMAGDVGFDPIGFSSTFNLLWLREAEIKHGRVCMLAWTGFVATDLGFTLPGEMHQVIKRPNDDPRPVGLRRPAIALARVSCCCPLPRCRRTDGACAMRGAALGATVLRAARCGQSFLRALAALFTPLKSRRPEARLP